MVKQHLKRIALPRTWSVPRKPREPKVFVSRPNPGKSLMLGISINTFLKELAQIVDTKREVKEILRYKHVYVNQTLVRDEKFPVGLFDVVHIAESEVQFRLTLSTNGKLAAIEIPAAEKDTLPKRIENKTIIRGGKLQFNLFGSGNILTTEKASVGDVFLLTKGKITKTISLQKGETAMLIAGRHCGKKGTIVAIEDSAIVLDVDGKHITTLKRYAYAVDAITV